MNSSWRELEFFRSRTRRPSFHVRLRPRTVWHESSTFRAAVVSVAVHIGIVALLVSAAANRRDDSEVRPKPLLDGDLEVVFLSPKESPRVAPEPIATPASRESSESPSAEREKPDLRETVTSSPRETPRPKNAAKREGSAAAPPQPTTKPERFAPPTRVERRQIAPRTADAPNTLAKTTALATAARLPASETSRLSALPFDATVAVAATPSKPLEPVSQALPEPVYRTPERANGARSPNDGESSGFVVFSDGTPASRRRAQVGHSLREVARAIAAGDGPRSVDLVFLLDVSGSMDNNIRAVADNVVAMMSYLRTRGYDATFGVVKFKVSTIRVFPQTRDAERLRRLLDNFQVGGDERALDAIAKAVRKVRFRDNVQKRLVLVTDEPLKGTGTFAETLALVRADEIVVDVIGLNDPEHRQLASETGGTWHRIPGDGG